MALFFANTKNVVAEAARMGLELSRMGGGSDNATVAPSYSPGLVITKNGRTMRSTETLDLANNDVDFLNNDVYFISFFYQTWSVQA